MDFTNKETRVLNLFNSDPYKSRSTLEFNERGILMVVRVISSLRHKGADITSTREEATDSFNNTHLRVAHYLFRGWK